MKKLKWYDRLLFLINSVCAFVLLLSYLIPFVKPHSFSLISVLSLAVPLLIILNALFVIYWLLKVKKQLILSALVLLLGYQHLGSLYKFSGSKNEHPQDSISILSYNVRLFNVYKWLDQEGIDQDIMELIGQNDPDIVCFQEFRPTENTRTEAFPYKHEMLSGNKMQHGQMIWSKYPIINKGTIPFDNTANSAIYADILALGDTIRVYNVHLQSARIDARKETFDRANSGRLFKRAATTFKMQQTQAEKVLKHMESCSYKLVLSGDFNNTAFSYVYKILKGDKRDTFVQAGNGFGRTYNFPYFPVRIDFILADKEFAIYHFKTFNEKLSDHYPVMTILGL